MAGKSKNKQNAEADGEEGQATKKSRKMLLAAAFMCMASLGAGFFLARSAFLEDAEKYEADSPMAEKAEKAEEEDYAAKDGGKEKAKEGYGAEGKEAAKGGGKKDDEDYHEQKEVEIVDDGLLDFGEVMTNIESIGRDGQPVRGFLKVNLMVVYRAEEGAGDLLKKRQAFMRDLFNGYLRGLTEEDVRGMAGLLYVKAELLKRARAAAGNDLPQEILIKDLIVQ